MSAFTWHLRRAVAGLGLPGLVALVVLAAVAAHAWLVTSPAVARVEQLRQDILRLEARAKTQATPVVKTEVSRQTLEQRFPDERRVTEAVGRLHAIAARTGIALTKGDFKLEQTAGTSLDRYVMQLPIEADYRLLRRFVRAAMADQEALALEEISIRREDPKLSVVQAQLRFVLYVVSTRG